MVGGRLLQPLLEKLLLLQLQLLLLELLLLR